MDKENKYVAVTVLLIIAALASAVKGFLNLFSPSSSKIWFIGSVLLLISAFAFPIISISISTKKELKQQKKTTAKTPELQTGIRVVSHDEMRVRFDEELKKIPLVDPVLSESIKRRRHASDLPEVKMNNITRTTNPEKLFPLVVLDTETTGLQASKNDIIEVAAIKFKYPFSPVSAFSVLTKPRGVIPADASAVNGITDEMVKDCPYFGEIVDSFAEFISGCNIVGHNLPFDLKFLYVGGLDLPENVKYYDTQDLAKKTLIREGQKKYDHHAGRYVECEDYDVDNYKLETLCEHYGIYRGTKHRALSDVYATAIVFKNLIHEKAEISFPE